MVIPLSTICEKDLGVLTVNNKCSNPSLQCTSAVQKATQLQGRMSRFFSYRDKYPWIMLITTTSRVLCQGLVTLA